HSAKVAIYERVPCLGPLSYTFGEPEMPCRVFLPGMPLEECVLVIGAWLHLAPIAVQYVLPGIDEPAAVLHSGLIHRIFRHVVPPFRFASERIDERFLCKAEPVIHTHHE